MKVIGAGLSRTGTMSTQAALEVLGYRCYHMTEVGRSRGHLATWQSFLSGQSEMNWNSLFTDYLASVDTPSCLYYREIMQAFPSARVLLTLRDPDKWYESLVSLSTTLEEFRSLAEPHPRLAAFLSVTDMVGMKLTGGDISRENCVRAFHQHNNEVREHVPKDQLLVFRVEDGWAPLCDFLGCENPTSPFPHLNEGRSTIVEFIEEWLLSHES